MKKALGFTLIEILIALAVFAILATITSSALYNSFNTRTRVAEQLDRLSDMQLAIILIERDTQQITIRDIHAKEMHKYPAFIGDERSFEFTRSGFANPGSTEKRSILKRVAILCQGNRLIRRTWFTLDTVNRQAYQEKVLLEQLASCNFAYLNQNLQSLNEWQTNAVQQNQPAEPLPKAIQMNLKLANSDKMNYLFAIPEAIYVDK
jgi:general secretion pathway protein J